MSKISADDILTIMSISLSGLQLVETALRTGEVTREEWDAHIARRTQVENAFLETLARKEAEAAARD